MSRLVSGRLYLVSAANGDKTFGDVIRIHTLTGDSMRASFPGIPVAGFVQEDLMFKREAGVWRFVSGDNDSHNGIAVKFTAVK